jgi:hypothetical protein
MKHCNENDFNSTLNEVNWDIPFIFEDLDDIVNSWETLFNDTVESHAPWRQNRFSRESQAPWMTKEMRSVLPNVTPDFSRLLNFVAARLDGDSKFKIPAITINGVLEALKSLKTCKSTGTDNISARFLKIAAPVIAPSISKIINMSLEKAVFPTRWKTAEAIPLYKDGERDNVTNYRPISILPVVSKIIERHVHNHLYVYMTANDLIYNRQSGFRQFHSTETALIKVN